MGTQPSVQCLLPKESFGAGVIKCAKTGIKVFLYCLTLFVILIFPKIFCKEFCLETKTS